MFLILAFSLTAWADLGSEALAAKASALAHTYFSPKSKQDDRKLSIDEQVRLSPLGVHVSYRRSYQTIPILETPRAIHFDRQLKQVLSASQAPSYHSFPEFKNVNEQYLREIIAEQGKQRAMTYQEEGRSRWYRADGENLIPMLRIELRGPSPIDALWVELDSRSGRILRTYNPVLTNRQEGRGQIWRRNPIAASGDPQSDYLIDVPLRGLDGSGYLRGDYVNLVDVEVPLILYYLFFEVSRYAPFYTPGAAFEPSFNYTYAPEDLRFQEVSAYYWIDSAQRYLQSHGYHVMERPIPVHVHMFEGSNAAFFGNFIGFGDGIIHTADDYDVVTHEYGHAVLDDIVGERFQNELGSTFHEGFADFFAYLVGQDATEVMGPDRYPQLVAEYFGTFKMGSPGYLRSLYAPNFRYPNLRGEPHLDGQLWSSAFYEIARAMGNEASLHLVLESLYRTNSPNPTVIGQTLLETDRLLFDGNNQALIERVLRARGLLGAEQTVPRLELNTPITLAGAGSFLTFRTPDVISPLKLTFKTKQSGNTLTIVMQEGHIPVLNDYIKAQTATDKIEWDLADARTYPLLKPNTDYYIAVKEGPQLTASLAPTQLEFTPSLVENKLQPVRMEIGQKFSFKLEGAENYRRIAIYYRFRSVFYLTVAAGAPLTAGDQSGQVIRQYTSGSDYFLVDLAIFEGNPEIFLSIDNVERLNQGEIRWQSIPDQEPTIEIGAMTTQTLGEPWENSRTFTLPEGAEAMEIRGETNKPFILHSPGHSVPVRSTLQNGRNTILIMRGQGDMSTDHFTSFLVEYPYTGTYHLELTGTKGETTEIGLFPIAKVEATQVAIGARIKKTLAPNALVFYNLEPSPGTVSVMLKQEALTSNQKIAIYFNNGKLQPLYGSDIGQFDKDHSRFKANIDPESAETYWLWFHNFGTTSLELDCTLTTTDQPDPVHTLVDGTEITMPSESFVNLLGTHEYKSTWTIEPPPGTQQVHISYEEIHNAASMEVLLPSTKFFPNRFKLHDAFLDANELNFTPDHPFPIQFIWYSDNHKPGQNPPKFRVRLQYNAQTAHNGQITPAAPKLGGGLISNISWPTELQIPAGTRQLDLAWTPIGNSLHADIRLTAQKGLELPSDLGLINKLVDSAQLFSIQGSSPYQSIEDSAWVVNQRMVPNYQYMVGTNPNAKPYGFEWAARYRDQRAATRLTVPTHLGSAQLSQAQLRFINPGSVPLELSFSDGTNSTSVQVAAGGFFAYASLPGQTLDLEANGPLLSFQGYSGPGWFSLAGSPSFPETALLLPHISPDGSDWTAYLSSEHSGSSTLSLIHPDQTSETRNPGLAALSNPESTASWRRLEAGKAPDTSFPEATLSATEFWQNGNQVVADCPPNRGAQTFFVPHLPDNPEWWSGLTLANTSTQWAEVKVIAFSRDGALVPVHNFSLAPGASRVALMAEFLPPGQTTQELTWLRIDASQDLLSMEFMGGIHAGDSAGFALPDRDGTELILPGNTLQAHHGIAIVNTVAQEGEIKIQARDPQGQILNEWSYNLTPNQRKLLTEADLNLDESKAYTLHIQTEDLRLVALQLDIDNTGSLAATPAQVIQ